jgi:hypothetical protein
MIDTLSTQLVPDRTNIFFSFQQIVNVREGVVQTSGEKTCHILTSAGIDYHCFLDYRALIDYITTLPNAVNKGLV